MPKHGSTFIIDLNLKAAGRKKKNFNYWKTKFERCDRPFDRLELAMMGKVGGTCSRLDLKKKKTKNL